jgi:hypothetical protein
MRSEEGLFCPDCGEELNIRSEVPSYCHNCGNKFSQSTRAKASNLFVVKEVKNLDKHRYDNLISPFYEVIKQMDFSYFYSDSRGTITKDTIMKSLKQVGLTVEYVRGEYELEKQPKHTTIDEAVVRIPRFGGFRELVLRRAKDESGKSTIMRMGDSLLDKKAKGWPMELLSIPEIEDDNSNSNADTFDSKQNQQSNSKNPIKDNRNYRQNLNKLNNILKQYNSGGDHGQIYRKLERDISNSWSKSADKVYLKESYTLKHFLDALEDIFETRSVSMEQWKYITREGDLRSCVVALHVKGTVEQAGDVEWAVTKIENSYQGRLKMHPENENYTVQKFTQDLNDVVERGEVEKLPETFNLKQTVSDNRSQSNNESRSMGDSFPELDEDSESEKEENKLKRDNSRGFSL